jgi:thymidylate synthase (FAD)
VTEISVEYVDHMGDDLFITNVARVSFYKWHRDMGEGDIRLLSYLASHEHTSPFRHTCISLRCKVPVFLARQLAKHQAGLSWNEVSRRYVDSGFEYYFPDSWKARPDASIKQGSGGYLGNKVSNAASEMLQQVVSNCEINYKLLLHMGVAPEEARMVMPQNMMVEYIWTGNLFSFYHIYKLRSHSTAQTLAQEFAHKVDEVVCRLFPESWKALKENIK